jgi:broad specificity phosphatase PhoE
MSLLAAVLTASAVGLTRVAPDARRLILVRHGAVSRENCETPLKPGAFYGGNVEVPLSKEGEAEAIAAAQWIASGYNGAVSTIWASPMRRALFGARAIGTALAAAQDVWSPPMNIETSEAFREIDRGPIGKGWTGLTAAEIEERDGPNAIARFAMETTYGAYREINGGEGFCDLRLRVLEQRNKVLEKMPLGSVGVIVSHMWVTRAMLAEALGELNPMNVDVPTASLSVIDYPCDFTTGGLADGKCAQPTVIEQGFTPPSA